MERDELSTTADSINTSGVLTTSEWITTLAVDCSLLRATGVFFLLRNDDAEGATGLAVYFVPCLLF